MTPFHLERVRLALSVLVPWDESGAADFCISNWAETTDCGMTFCAGGKIAADPRVIADGLYLGQLTATQKVVCYQGLRHFDALAAYFDIDVNQAERIFSIYRNADSPKIDLARLRQKTLADVIAGLLELLPPTDYWVLRPIFHPHGYDVWDTGGGCTTWGRSLPDGGSVVVSFDAIHHAGDPNTPEWGAERYDAEGCVMDWCPSTDGETAAQAIASAARLASMLAPT